MKKTAIRFICAVAVLLLTACALVSCASAEKQIIGEWVDTNNILGIETETVYVFNEDGTGTKKALLTADFTYTIKDDKLFLTYNTLGIETTDEFTFELKDDTLTLTKGGNVVTLDRKAS